MRIEKRAGQFRLETFTDGYPNWCRLYAEDAGDERLFSVRPEELHDLRYVIDRVLVELEARKNDA